MRTGETLLLIAVVIAFCCATALAAHAIHCILWVTWIPSRGYVARDMLVPKRRIAGTAGSCLVSTSGTCME